MEPLGLTQTRLAEHLGISRNGLNEIINGKRGVSPEMAWKLSDTFRTGPEVWINLQANFDLWHARQRHQPVPAIA
jgi:addiction module HigA family antidote